MRTTRAIILTALAAVPAVAAAQVAPGRGPAGAATTAQGTGVTARLESRGVSPELAQQVAAIAAQVAPSGVPAGPLADKAIEGWAKQVPPARIVAAVRLFARQMADAAQAIEAGGMPKPPGQVVAAAAEAMRGGIGPEEIRSVVRAAPDAGVAAPGLSVAAALAAQGIGGRQAVAIVVGAMHSHHALSELLDLPSVARAMQDEGMSPGEVGRQMLEGGEGHEGGGAGMGGEHERPPQMPPGTGRGHEPENPGDTPHPPGG